MPSTPHEVRNSPVPLQRVQRSARNRLQKSRWNRSRSLKMTPVVSGCIANAKSWLEFLLSQSHPSVAKDRANKLPASFFSPSFLKVLFAAAFPILSRASIVLKSSKFVLGGSPGAKLSACATLS